MVFVPSRLQHFGFGPLVLVKFMTWSKPKTKELPRRSIQKHMPKINALSYYNIIILIKQPLQGHHTAKAVVIRVIILNSRTPDPLAFPWKDCAQEPVFQRETRAKTKKEKQR
jgi:hypothetical protein